MLAFLNQLAELSLPVAEEEMRALKAFALADSGVSDLKAWMLLFIQSVSDKPSLSYQRRL